MKEPFFSILLPTKNRSEIVGNAIRTVLRQTFADFELIVSDNDDSPEATAKVVAEFKDERIRYLRTTGKFAMHENWDNAFDQARGKYVFVLEDKMRLAENALEILHAHFTRHPDSVFVYDLGSIPHSQDIPGKTGACGVTRYTSDEVVKMFCHFTPLSFKVLPKGLNSVAPRELLSRLKKESPTGFLFSYVCPDYAVAFMQLSKIDEVFWHPECLTFILKFPVADKYSNGEASYTKGPLLRRFMTELPVKAEEIVRPLPIKSEWLWINPVTYDFLTKYRRPSSKLGINWVSYHAFCITLILISRERGGDMAPEIAEMRRSLRERGLLFTVRVLADAFGRCLVGLSGRVFKNSK